MNPNQKTVQKALGALNDDQFVNVFEWVGNGYPLMTGRQVRIQFINDAGEP